MPHRVIRCIVAASFLLCASEAVAQTADPPPPISADALDPFDASLSGRESLAAAEFDRGVLLFRSARPAQSAEAFERSFALLPRPGTLFNAAQAHRSAGLYLRAIDAFDHYLQLGSLTETREAQVRQALRELRAAVPSVTLHMQPPGGRISVDGRMVPIGAAIPMDPGRHTATATAPGHFATALSFDVRAQESRQVSISLERDHSLIRQWWFWAGVGTSVTIAAVVATVAIVARSNSTASCGTLTLCVSPH